MTSETIQIIITIALVIAIVCLLLKKIVKIAAVIGLFLILFNVGFIMDGAQVRSFFNIDEFLKSEQADIVEDAFNDFDQKRNEYAVIDADKVYDSITSTISKGATAIVKGIGKIDIVAFANAVAEKIVSASNQVIDYDALRAEIKRQLSGISDSDLDAIIEQINEKIASGSHR